MGEGGRVRTVSSSNHRPIVRHAFAWVASPFQARSFATRMSFAKLERQIPRDLVHNSTTETRPGGRLRTAAAWRRNVTKNSGLEGEVSYEARNWQRHCRG